MELSQIAAHAAYALRYAHIVVVQDYEQVIVCYGCVVDALESKASAHGAVANHRNYTTGCVAVALIGHSHTQCGRYGVGCMSCGEGIIFTLIR